MFTQYGSDHDDDHTRSIRTGFIGGLDIALNLIKLNTLFITFFCSLNSTARRSAQAAGVFFFSVVMSYPLLSLLRSSLIRTEPASIV